MSQVYRCHNCRLFKVRSDYASYRNGRRKDICEACIDNHVHRPKPEEEPRKPPTYSEIEDAMRVWGQLPRVDYEA